MKKIFLYIVLFFAFTSCKVNNPSLMFRTEKNYPFTEPSQQTATEEYKIAPNDIISFMVFTKNGEKIINPIESQTTFSTTKETNLTYLVEKDGQIKLPVINRVLIAGKTIKESEKFLEEKYASFYNEPFVKLNVLNRRVIIFPGSITGEAKVINLVNENTTLIEAIAQAGGISGGKSYKIKLIRGGLKNPLVFRIDLSSLQTARQGYIILQANDIIYVDTPNRLSRKFIDSLMPYVYLVSSTAVILYTLTKTK